LVMPRIDSVGRGPGSVSGGGELRTSSINIGSPKSKGAADTDRRTHARHACPYFFTSLA
jgi:hypothetical protein